MYEEYCIHGQPIYHQKYCSGCRRIKEAKQQKRYEEYWESRRINFIKYFNEQYDYYFTNPSIDVESKIKIRDNDKFASLKRSKSQEQLKKQYYKLARIYHPDKGGSVKLMQKLSQLYEILKLRIGG